MKKITEFLQEVEGSKGAPGSFGEKVLKFVAILIAAVLVIVFLQIATFFGMFNWVESWVRTLTGLDMYLVKGISFLLLAIFFGTSLSGMVWSFLPIPQKNKKRKRFIFLSVLALFFFGAYFTSRKVYFDPENGQPLQYFSVGVNGEYNFSSSEGYDPVTGDKLKQVDKATVIQHLNGSSTSLSIDFSVNDKPMLTGLEKDSRFYPIEFKNETDRNLYLCISFKQDVKGPIIIQRIPTKQSIRLSLIEGIHYFSYMDNNGNAYGGRDRGSILFGTDQSMDIMIGAQLYNLKRVFSLTVLALDDQKVTLELGEVLHSKELTTYEKIEQMAIIFMALIVFGFLGWISYIILTIYYQNKERKVKSQKK